MSTEQIGEKEKAQILLNEYNSLRSEINARLSNVFQVGAIAAGTLALAYQQRVDGRAVVSKWIIFGVSAGLAFSIWVLFRNFYKAALRVQQLESDINGRAKETLLLWENKWGGLAGNPRVRECVLRVLKVRPPDK